MKNSKIVALVAAAALLVLGFAFTSFAASYNWYQQDGEWRCKNSAGEDYYSAWAKSGADYYWLDDEGWMSREALVDDDTKYVDADGKMVKNQWVKLSDDEGNDYWNYFQAGGKKMVGKDEPKPVTVSGKKYIFNPDGKMLSGWVGKGYDDLEEDYEWKDGVYYCGGEDDGAVTYGWKQIECYNEDEDFVDNNYWFWFGTNGKKFCADPSLDKFSGSDAAAILEQKTINGKKYAFDQYGVMKAEWEQTEATESIASASAYAYAWFQDAEIGAKFANGWFRVVPSAKFDEGNNEDDTAKWFYAKSGKLYQNVAKTINGKKYAFNNKGEMIVGLCVLDYTKVGTDEFVVAEGIDDAAKLDSILKGTQYGEPNDWGVYYFSADEDNDGSMKTGAQTITVDGDEYNCYFSTKAGSKGLGLSGKQGNKYYWNGIKVAANDEKADYLIYTLYETDKFKDGIVHPERYFTFQQLYDAGTPVEGVVTVDMTDYVMISKTGAVAASGTKKDGNGYKATFKKIDKVTYLLISQE